MPPTTTFCLGISHHTTPVAVREAVSCRPAALAQTLAADPELRMSIHEWVVLSTCNRFELYVQLATDADAERLLFSWLQQTRPFDGPQLQPDFFGYHGEDAARHLLRVAAGLDSQVLGEPQILGQVTDAFEAGREQGTIGPHLTALFQAAIHAGKRARTKTAISCHPSSISSVAVSHIEAIKGALVEQDILVIGAGEMAELAVNALRKRGVKRLSVVNRTCERARALLGEGTGDIYRLDQIHEALVAADAVISTTGAPHLILTHDLVESAMRARADRPMLLVDIAVPHDVESTVVRVPGVSLVNLDTLNDGLESARQARANEVPLVDKIVQEELGAWKQTARELRVRPVIRELRQKAETIRQRQLERTLKHLGDVDPAMRQHITRLSQALVNQLLHGPTLKLREEAGNGSSSDLANAVQDLFDLESE